MQCVPFLLVVSKFSLSLMFESFIIMCVSEYVWGTYEHHGPGCLYLFWLGKFSAISINNLSIPSSFLVTLPYCKHFPWWHPINYVLCSVFFLLWMIWSDLMLGHKFFFCFINWPSMLSVAILFHSLYSISPEFIFNSLKKFFLSLNLMCSLSIIFLISLSSLSVFS